MAGTPRPAEPDPDNLVAVARSLRGELARSRRARQWLTGAVAALTVAFITFGTVFGFYVYSAHQVARCVDRYAVSNAAVQRARAVTLRHLVDSTLHLRSQADYRRAVLRFEAQPVPPLPPPNCR